MPWPAFALGAVAVAAVGTWLARRTARRAGARALLRHRARVDRYKLARRSYVRAELLADASLADAVRHYAAERALDERRGQLFEDFLVEARRRLEEKGQIEIYRDTLAQLDQDEPAAQPRRPPINIPPLDTNK